MKNSNELLVSICCITYNHEPFIENTMKCFLNQKTNFEYNIVIGEDCSTDNTREIILKIAKKNPEKFRLILHEQNVGAMANEMAVMNTCNGKYIALCEGDDFWTDPLKLQKQVDFLEKNSEFSLCFHNAIVRHEGKKVKDYFFCDSKIKDITSIDDVINKWYIPTASMLFRKDLLFPLPIWYTKIYNSDYAVQLLLSSKGKIKYINEVMSVYRKQKGGLNSTMKSEIIWQHLIKLMVYFNLHSNFKYNNLIETRIKELFQQYNNILLNKKNKVQKMLSLTFWNRKISKIFN